MLTNSVEFITGFSISSFYGQARHFDYTQISTDYVDEMRTFINWINPHLEEPIIRTEFDWASAKKTMDVALRQIPQMFLGCLLTHKIEHAISISYSNDFFKFSPTYAYIIFSIIHLWLVMNLEDLKEDPVKNELSIARLTFILDVLVGYGMKIGAVLSAFFLVYFGQVFYLIGLLIPLVYYFMENRGWVSPQMTEWFSYIGNAMLLAYCIGAGIQMQSLLLLFAGITYIISMLSSWSMNHGWISSHSHEVIEKVIQFSTALSLIVFDGLLGKMFGIIYFIILFSSSSPSPANSENVSLETVSLS